MAGAQPLSLTSSAQSTSAQPPPRPRGSVGISHPTPSVAVSGVSAVAQPPAPSATGAITGGLAVPLTGTTEMPIRTGSTEGEQSDVGKKGQAGKVSHPILRHVPFLVHSGSLIISPRGQPERLAELCQGRYD